MKKQESDKKSRNQCSSNLRQLLSNPVYPQQEKNKKYMLKLIYLDLPSLARKLHTTRWAASLSKNKNAHVQASKHSPSPLKLPERNRSFAAASRKEFWSQRSRNLNSGSFCTNYGDDSVSSEYSLDVSKKHNSSIRNAVIKHYVSTKDYMHRSRQNSLRSAQSTRKSSRNPEQKFSEYLTQSSNTVDSSQCFLETVLAFCLFFEQGKNALKTADYARAMQLFEKAFKVNPGNIEALLYKGIVYMDTNRPQDAINVLKQVTKYRAEHLKSAHLLLAIAYHRCKKIEAAIELNEVLERDHNYLEALISRGNLLVEQKRWEEGRRDFQRIIDLNPGSGASYLGLAECAENLGNLELAIEAYKKAATATPGFSKDVCMKLIRLEIRTQQLAHALTHLDDILKHDPADVKLILTKGRVLEKQRNIGEAALHYEQAASHGGEELAGEALFKLAKMRLREKDYYEAAFDMRRITKERSKIKLYRTLIEGVVSLMKRKHKIGLEMLNTLKEDVEQLKADMRLLYLLFLGYGNMVKHRFVEALECYCKAEKVGKLDEAAVFNKLVCEGVLASKGGDHDTALTQFTHAIKLFPESKEGYIHRLLVYVALYLDSHNQATLKKAAEELDMALSKSRKDAELHFYKGLLEMVKHRYMEGLQEFSKTIKYADESVARHYFVRGFCEGCINMFKESLEDFDIAIKLEQNYPDAYLFKGRCSYLSGDASTAFVCYQQLIILNKDDPMMHVHAGNLLMASGAFEDAAKAYANANDIQETAVAYYQFSKCATLLGNLGEAIDSLEKGVSLKGSANMLRDLKTLQVLKSMSDPAKYEESSEFFTAMLSQSKKQAEQIEAPPSEKGTTRDYCKADLEKAYAHPIFEAEDWVAYRFVTHFYLKEYEEALADLRTLNKILAVHKNNYFGSDKEMQLDEVLMKEINEFRFSPMTINECKYNMVLCLLFVSSELHSYQLSLVDEAADTCAGLLKSTTAQEQPWLHLLLYAIHSSRGNTELGTSFAKSALAKRSLTNAEGCVNPTDLAAGKPIKVGAMVHKGKLAYDYPCVEFKFGTICLEVRPAFNYPMVRPVNMVPAAGDFVLYHLNPMTVPCFPEPPWIKRCSYGIKFTDELQVTDSLDMAMEAKEEKKRKDVDSSSSCSNSEREVNEREKKYGKTSIDKSSPYYKANSTGNAGLRTLI